ncbi:MAG: DUF1905 domain-containing protein [Chloroflexi bacterium]|nr:DUF1905 domain-containing protein [Chloroflexota bacterium]
MLNLTYSFSAELWATEGKGAWHFFTVPLTPSQDIKSFLNPNRTGWGAVRVRVTIGSTTWETSIFPDSRTGQFILPVKKMYVKRNTSKPAKVSRCNLKSLYKFCAFYPGGN